MPSSHSESYQEPSLMPPILNHCEPAEPIVLQTDASGFAMASILNQYNGFRSLKPVNFSSRKYSGAEQNYLTYDRELLAIMETKKQWHHYLEEANHKVLIQCKHKRLKYIETSEVLSRRQARWVEIFSLWDFIIEHLEGMKNPAESPSGRPNYEISYEIMTERLLATLAATTITESYWDLLPEIKAAQETNCSATKIRPTLVDVSTADKSQWRSIHGALTYERRIYVPAALRGRVTSLFHDNPESGHLGAQKSDKLVSRDLYWPVTEWDIRKYGAGCELCHRIKAPHHTCYGLNMPLPPPSSPCKGLTVNFVTNLPESTPSVCTGILVIVDYSTNMATYLPCR